MEDLRDAQHLRAIFPGAQPDLIREHPETSFTHADVDGVFFDVWYDENDSQFHASVRV